MAALRTIIFPATMPVSGESRLPTTALDLFDTEDCDDSGACAHVVDQHAQEDERGEAI